MASNSWFSVSTILEGRRTQNYHTLNSSVPFHSAPFVSLSCRPKRGAFGRGIAPPLSSLQPHCFSIRSSTRPSLISSPSLTPQRKQKYSTTRTNVAAQSLPLPSSAPLPLLPSTLPAVEAAGPTLQAAAPVVLHATVADLASNFLGILVICGSLFLKVPQILRILKNKSAQGLSLVSFELECLGYTISLAYCVAKQVPFLVYGELFFILAQSLVLLALLYRFSPDARRTEYKVPAFLAIVAVLFSNTLQNAFGIPHALPVGVLEGLYNFQTSMFTISRLPQMWTNFQNSSTGELSLTSSLLSVAGCIARLFTSIHEHAPSSMVLASILGLLSHGFLMYQILLYWPQPKIS